LLDHSAEDIVLELLLADVALAMIEKL